MAANTNGASGILNKRLQREVLNLIQYIERLRKEIAGIAQEKDDQTTFEGMADRLDAIVHSTAEATHTILSAMESADEFVERLRSHPQPSEIDSICDQIAAKTMQATEACSFQDLTGQRISKVIGSMKFVEERVNAMAELCGRRHIEALASEWSLPEQIDGELALDGPRRTGQGISQAEIDELFS